MLRYAGHPAISETRIASYNKETKDKIYADDPFKVKNFKRNKNGNLICPQGREFIKLCDKPVKDNKFGRTTEVWQCKTCKRCPLKEKCHKSKENRILNFNEEHTSFHKEVINNL